MFLEFESGSVAFLGRISITQPLLPGPATAGCGLAEAHERSCVCRAGTVGLAVKRGDGGISCSQVSACQWVHLASPESRSRVFAHISYEIRDQASLGDGLEVGKISLKVDVYAWQNSLHFKGRNGTYAVSKCVYCFW